MEAEVFKPGSINPFYVVMLRYVITDGKTHIVSTNRLTSICLHAWRIDQNVNNQTPVRNAVIKAGNSDNIM